MKNQGIKRLTKSGFPFGELASIFSLAVYPAFFVPSLFSQDNNQTGFGDSDQFSLDTNSYVSGDYNPENSNFADSDLFTLDTVDGNQSTAENNQTGFADSDSLFSLDTTNLTGPLPDASGFNDLDGYFTLDTSDDNQSGNSSNGDSLNANNINSFQANSVPDLELWLDANDLMSFTLSENNVTAWSDKSGNGHVLDQVLGPGVPIRSISSDGLAHVFFGGNTSLSTNSDFMDANYTIFTVSAQSGNQNARLISSTSRNWALGYFAGKFDSFYFDGWVNQGNSNSDNQIHFHMASVNDLDQSNSWVDFSQVATDSAGANNSFYFPGKLCLGGRGSEERSIGKVAELIYFSRVLAPTEREKTEGYLAHKWGSSSRLPNGHPYKNSPPTFHVVEQNATVSGTVYYDGVISGSAYVWALEANGTKAAEVILPDGNGSFVLNVKKGRGYDFKAFIDGTGDGYPQGYEVWKHHADWNNTSKKFNLTQVDGNLTGINFSLWDGDNDQDGFLNWHEYQAGTEYNNVNDSPGTDFGLVAHWKFDEANGTTLHDSSGNDVNGTLVGFENGWSPGRSGGALRFDGVNDHVSFEGINKLDDIRPFSFSGWIKLDGNGSGYIIAKRSAGSGYWRYGSFEEMAWLVRQGSTGTPSLTYNHRPQDYSWEHIALTWSGFFGNNYMKLYHNGQLATNVTKQGGSGSLVSDAGNYLTLGNRPQNNSSYFKGWMDDFRLWDRVITADEVDSIFKASPETNATVSGTVSHEGTVPGPVVVWAFNEKNAKVAQQVLPNGPGQFSLSLPAGHSYDIKAFRDGNGNGNLDVGIGEPYAHWGAWENGSFVKLPVYGDRNDADFAITWENDQDNDGYTQWEESQAGTSDQNASSKPNFAPIFQTDGNLTVAENQTVIFEFNATDLENSNLTYAIEYGDDKEIFELNASNGELSFKTPRDFENPEDKNADNVYEFTASVSDGSKQSVLNLFVRVTDENETNSTGTGSGGKGGSGGKQPLTDANFQTAVNLWFTAEANATDFYGHISDWNTSAVTDMTEAFKDRSSFNDNISGWDTSSVITMDSMFWGASTFNQPIGDWDVSSVQDTKAMFLQAGSFNQDIGNWDTASLTETVNMFYAALSFNQDIGNWNTSAFTNMGQMFRGATAFNQNLKNWNTSKVGSFFHTFDGTHSFDQDISDWNVSSAYAMTNMFGNPLSLSDQNKGLIHASFSTNSSWPYNWSSFVDEDDASGGGDDLNTTQPHHPGGDDNATSPHNPTGDKNSTAPNDPEGGDHNSTEPYDPGGDHNTMDPSSDTNDTHPFSIPVFELKVSDLAELTGMEDVKTGGSFALTELYEPADPQKTFLQLEEAVFDGQMQEWNVDFEGRVLPLKSSYSAYQLLEEYLMQNQLYPAGYISFVDHNTSNPNYPGNEHNGTTTGPGGGGDHNGTGTGTDTNQTHPHSIPVFNFQASSLADLTGLLDTKQGGTFAMTVHDDPLDPEVISFELEEVEFDQELQEWNFSEEGRVFPLKSEFSDLVIFDNYLLQNQLDPVGHIEDFASEYPEDDHNGTEPWDAPVFEFEISTLADLTGHKDIKMGGAFALIEHGEPAQSEKPDFELEEVAFDEELQEWYFPEVGRVFSILAEFSDFMNLENYMLQNQIYPTAYIYLEDHLPDTDHIPVFDFRVADLANLSGVKDIKEGGSFAFTEHWEPARPDNQFIQLEEVVFDEELQEWSLYEEGRVFPLDSRYSEFIKVEDYLEENLLLPVGYIFIEKDDSSNEDLHDDDESGKPNQSLANPPIVQTLKAESLEDGIVIFTGRILFDGGAPIEEAGIWVEDENSGEMHRLTIDIFQLPGQDFEIETDDLSPASKYHYFAFAQNEAGESRGYGLTLRTADREEEKNVIQGAKPIEDGWMISDWFGTFRTFDNRWTYHDTLGWVFISEEQKEGVWMWTEPNGWLWTDPQTWPFLWQHEGAHWLYLFPTPPGLPPILYDYGRSEYEYR